MIIIAPTVSLFFLWESKIKNDFTWEFLLVWNYFFQLWNEDTCTYFSDRCCFYRTSVLLLSLRQGTLYFSKAFAYIHISLPEQNKNLFYLSHLFPYFINSVESTPDGYIIVFNHPARYYNTSIGLSTRLSRTTGRDWLSAPRDVTTWSSHINWDPNRKEWLRPALQRCRRASFQPQYSAPRGPPIMGNPRVFFDITIDGDNAGRIIMEVRQTPSSAGGILHLCVAQHRYFLSVPILRKRKKNLHHSSIPWKKTFFRLHFFILLDPLPFFFYVIIIFGDLKIQLWSFCGANAQ